MTSDPREKGERMECSLKRDYGLASSLHTTFTTSVASNLSSSEEIPVLSGLLQISRK
jgi:hypothetical protein